ncbi:putative ribonuclease H-like domain-containing protein [Tanacetum coccineum]
MSDEPLGDDSKPISYDVPFSNPLFDFNDDFTLCNDNPLFDEEFEDISGMDPPELTLVIDESTLLVTLPLPCTDVLGDAIIDMDLLLRHHLDTLSMGDREIDFNPSRDIEELERLLVDNPVPVPRVFDVPLGNFDSMSRSIENSDLFLEELTTEIGLDDSIPTNIDDRYYDSEGDILYFDNCLMKIHLPMYLQHCYLQSGKMGVIETRSLGFHPMPSPRPALYSPKEVMYRYYHPHLTSGDGFDHELRNPPFSSSLKDSPNAGFKPSEEEEKKDAEHPENEDSEVLNIEEPRVNQEKDEDVNIYGCVHDPNMPNLEEIVYSDDDEDVGAEADMTNLDTHIHVSPIPTTIIHKDHLVEQIIGDIHSAPQTRRMTKRVTDHEPKKVIQALTDPRWIEAMQDELLQFKLQQVWTSVDLPYGKRAIRTKWIYRNKKDERVARIKAIRLFLAYSSFKDFVVYQMDVKSAFLYGKIEEEVYVCQPSGFEDPEFPERVYKVEKELYGLHQAPRAWYETLSTYLLDNGFQRGQIDKTLFIKRVKGDILLVQVYVDDIIFGSTRKEMYTEFEKMMHKKFQISSMGELTFFLGLQVTQKYNGNFISQDKSMIGSLMYLTSSRPDIMFVVCACARFQVTLHAVKRIFRYLKGSPSLNWAFGKQTIVANSTTEAEYVAASSCCGQIDDWNGLEILYG